MKLLIDGYNLMFALNVVGQPGKGTSLFRSRLALLNMIASVLSSQERASTAIVFDAKNAPPGLPRKQKMNSITIYFADRREEADDMLIALIEASHHARELTVVTSDHKIQRAARRRSAQVFDSDVWFRDRLAEQRIQSPNEPDKPIPDISDAELATWLNDFHAFDSEDSEGTNNGADRDNSMEPHHDHEQPASLTDDDFSHPFPPGYGEDVLDEDDLADGPSKRD